MKKILCEKAYYKSVWCKEILRGLKKELKKRRDVFEIIFESQELVSEDTVYAIGSTSEWIAKAVADCNSLSIVPVVIFNQLNHAVEGRYHSVSSDISGSISAILNWLKMRGKNNICLYGVNPISIADLSRTECYMRRLPDSGYAFYNRGSLENCYRNFKESGREFDGVICTNDFAAISLVRHLLGENRDALSRIDIISCSQSDISRFFSEYIKSVNINFEDFGTNAYSVARLAEKNKSLSEISVTVKWDIDIPLNDDMISLINTGESVDTFYDDAELAEMLGLEELLQTLSDEDRKIISLMQSGMTYSDIGDECYISEQSVKYHVKQYMSICDVGNKSDFLKLLDKYQIKL